MHERIVTSALMSPSTRGELRLLARKRQRLMKQYLFLLFLSGLFLLTQFFGILAPGTPPDEAVKGSVEPSGITSNQTLLSRYDTRQSAVRNLAEILSISREELEAAKETVVSGNSSPLVEWSLAPTFVSALSSGESSNPSFVIKGPAGISYYGHYVKPGEKRQANALGGQSNKAGSFAVLKQTGNFISSRAAALKTDSCARVLTENTPVCPSHDLVKNSIAINNLTYKTEAKFIKTHPGDELAYSLSIRNMNSEAVNILPEIHVGDILEYSRLTDNAGGSLDQRTQILSWQKTVIPPKQTRFYNFKIQIVNSIPSVAQSNLNKASYDCRLSTFFGDTYSLRLACPVQKVVEKFINMPFNPLLLALAGVFFCISVLLYTRSYVLHRELDIILKTHRGSLK